MQRSASNAAHQDSTPKRKASEPSTPARRKNSRKGSEKPTESPKNANPHPAAANSKPQYGRRSSRKTSGATATDGVGEGADASKGWFSADDGARARVQDAVPENLKTVGDEEINAQASAALLARQQAEKERLAKAVAEAPTGYQTQMPRLTDLDIKSNWDKLLQSIHGDVDMSILTACLARELDEDVAWNPAMLLVQLTSDLHDAAELNGEDAAFVPVDESDIGLMKGGEVVRKRKEKGAVDESPAIPTTNKPAAAIRAMDGGAAAKPRREDSGRGPSAAGGGAPNAGAQPVMKEPASAKRLTSLETSKAASRRRDSTASTDKNGSLRRKSKDSSRHSHNAPEL